MSASSAASTATRSTGSTRWVSSIIGASSITCGTTSISSYTSGPRTTPSSPCAAPRARTRRARAVCLVCHATDSVPRAPTARRAHCPPLPCLRRLASTRPLARASSHCLDRRARGGCTSRTTSARARRPQGPESYVKEMLEQQDLSFFPVLKTSSIIFEDVSNEVRAWPQRRLRASFVLTALHARPTGCHRRCSLSGWRRFLDSWPTLELMLHYSAAAPAHLRDGAGVGHGQLQSCVTLLVLDLQAMQPLVLS